MSIIKQHRPACLSDRQAFTLVELLMAVAIIAVLSAGVIATVKPGQLLNKADDVADEHNIEQLEQALQQYVIKNFTFPAGISNTPATICSHGFNGNCVSLHQEIAHGNDSKKSFISEIPQSKNATVPSSGYEVSVVNGFINVGLVGSTAIARGTEPYRAYQFDGNNDKVTTPVTIPTGQAFTWSTWVRPSVIKTSRLIGQYTAGAAGRSILSQINDAEYRWYMNGVGTINSTLETPNDGVFVHLAAMYEPGNGMSLYVNGSLDTNVPGTTSIQQTPIVFGAEGSGTSYQYNGLMFDTRIYNEALTSDEVQYLASYGEDGTNPGISNLLAHYKTDDTHPTIAYDSSGNANHGAKSFITAATFHAEDDDIPYSFQNEAGFSKNIVKTSSSINWDAGFTASNTIALSDDAEIRLGVYDIGDSTEVQMIGFDNSNPNANFNTMDYAIYHTTNSGNNDYRVYENGSSRIILPVTPEVGDVMAVRKEGSIINYLINGTVYYTSTVDVPGDLVIDNSIYRPQSTMRDLTFYKNGEIETIDITSTTSVVESYIPRDESDTTKDVTGNNLQFSGSAL